MTRLRYVSDPLRDMLVVEFEALDKVFTTAVRCHADISSEWQRLMADLRVATLSRSATVHRWRLLDFNGTQPPEWHKAETFQWPS